MTKDEKGLRTGEIRIKTPEELLSRIKQSCPICGSNEILKQTKKLKCVDCFKSFKHANIEVIKNET